MGVVTPNPRLLASIRWTRHHRIAGAVIIPLAAIATGITDSLNLLAIAAGVAAGSLVAELTRPKESGRATRQASLDRRGITDYVGGFVLVTMAAAAACLAGATALALTLDGPTWDAVSPTPRWYVTSAAIALTVGAASVVLARRIARQPVLLSDDGQASVRQAIRATSITSVLGGGLIALGVGLYRVVETSTLNDSEASAVVRHGNNVFYFVMVAVVFGGLFLSFNPLPRAGREVRPGTGLAATPS